MEPTTRLDDLFVLAEQMEDMWPHPVVRPMRKTARELHLLHRRSLELRLVSCIDAATDAVMRTDSTVHQENVLAVVRNMAVLEGTAALIFSAVVSHASRPSSLMDLVNSSTPGFDRVALDDLLHADVDPLGPLGFPHMSECLLRAGEMRVFLGSMDQPWARNEHLFREAARAYLEMQRLCWPSV